MKTTRIMAVVALIVGSGLALHHAARNVGRGNGAELATYVVDKGKPLIVMVR
jgi:hypothetical protein